MKAISPFHTTPLLLAAAAALALAGCQKAAPPAAPPPPVVGVMTVEAVPFERSAVFIGQIDSPQNVEIRARVESFLDEIHFQEGAEVNAGDLLFVLDKKPYEERLASTMGRLAEAEAALAMSKLDVARITPLAAQGAAPQRDLDNAESAVLANEAAVATASAQVKSAELDLGYCEIRAPLSGRIGAKAVPIGSLVGRGEPTLLATISQTDPIWFNCNIGEADFLRAERAAASEGRKIGEMPVTLILSDGTEHPHPGKWIFTDRAVDATTATIRARAEFPDPEKLLRPGMFARARIAVVARQPAILVPERALSELQGKYFVWVVGEDKTVSQRAVTVADYRVDAGKVILEGLESGEVIVVEGAHKLRDGLAVIPGKPEAAAPQPEATPE